MGQRIVLFLATGFGVGRIPVAPGTFGTLSALPLIWIMGQTRALPGGQGIFLICLLLISVWIADRAEIMIGTKDPGCIVIDEMVGYCISMSLTPLTPAALVAGFLAFRCFDIFKPGPVRYFDRNFKGGAGVVLDDVMAGVMAAAVVKTITLTGMM